MATTGRSAKRKKKKDMGEIHHSGKSTVKDSSQSKWVSAEGDNHDEPDTGSKMIYYPSSGTSLPGGI